MSDQYYLQEGDEKTGPFTYDELVDNGLEINSRLTVGNSSTWQNASDLPEFNDYFEWRGYYFPTEDNLASFWWRLLAYVIDSIIISVGISIAASDFLISVYKEMGTDPGSTESLLARLKFNLVILTVSAVYHSIFESTPMRGSIGKRLCKLAVVDADGRRLSVLKALIRNFGKILSSLAFGIGYIAILWDDHKQAWHDKMAGTYVIIRNR
jgi:uncharacterized RDD family membrane protein YckC